MVTRLFILSTLTVFLGACAATSYTPVVDTKGLDRGQYEQDLRECRALAAEVDGTEAVGTDALIGGGVGAAGGAALGALSGDAGIGAATGAVLGAFGGGGAGGLSANERQKRILNNCLTGRGYRVLG